MAKTFLFPLSLKLFYPCWLTSLTFQDSFNMVVRERTHSRNCLELPLQFCRQLLRCAAAVTISNECQQNLSFSIYRNVNEVSLLIFCSAVWVSDILFFSTFCLFGITSNRYYISQEQDQHLFNFFRQKGPPVWTIFLGQKLPICQLLNLNPGGVWG